MTTTPTTLEVTLSEASGAAAAILALARQIIPLLPSIPNGVGMVLTALESALPLMTDQIPMLYQEIKTLIEDFKSKGAATADQIATADALIAQVDAHWAATKSAYLANHPARAGGAATDPQKAA